MLLSALLALQRRWARTLGRVIRRLIVAQGVPVTPQRRQQIAVQLHRETLPYRQQSYEAAVTRIREFDPHLTPAPIRDYPVAAVVSVLERATEPPARVSSPRARVTVAPAELDPLSRRQARRRVNVTAAPRSPAAVREVVNRVSVTMGRHIQQAGRDAIVDTADGAGEEVGWARLLSGAENCAFCAMLASRGPVYRSDKSATSVVGRPRGNRELGEAYHDNCDCETVLVRRGQPWEGQAEYERLERLWIAASSLDGEPRLAFNRAFRRGQKDPDLLKEIERLWEDSTEGLTGTDATDAFVAAVRANPPAALAAARKLQESKHNDRSS
ncbi:VG15 protein [Nocardia australiensis]|uniref:VG15 protein n=1 Tax=Nocardia australiensis TaxID=2887191 RepID=UPI001D155E85|nr:hypothetical protein [Nocardia australiensis]